MKAFRSVDGFKSLGATDKSPESKHHNKESDDAQNALERLIEMEKQTEKFERMKHLDRENPWRNRRINQDPQTPWMNLTTSGMSYHPETGDPQTMGVGRKSFMS